MDDEQPPMEVAEGAGVRLVTREPARERRLRADEDEVAVLVAARDLRTRVGEAVASGGLHAVVPLHLAAWASEHRAPVVVTDDGERVSALRSSLSGVVPDVAFVVLVDDPVPQVFRRLMASSAAVLPASAAEGQIRAAVAAAREALASLPIAIARGVFSDGAAGDAEAVLDRRETKWLGALADGWTVAALARSAGYSQREMYRLLSDVYSRLNATTRTEALLTADRRGLLRRASSQPGPGPQRSGG